MTEIQIPYLPSAQFFKILCRLGVNEQDVLGDSDSDPQIRTIGGTVSISAMVPRFRYTEADGRKRVVYTKTETYNIQTSTGELFDADGNIGVNLLNTNSPQMDPQEWTYRATVRPNGGEPFDVNIPSDPEGGVFDLGDGLVFTPSTGITDLETRVKALEDTQGSTPGLPVNFDEAVQDIVGSMIAAAGGSYNDAAGTITLPSGGSSTITADDTPPAPAEGASASYLVTSAVSWPAGLVWSTDPDGGVAPTITGTALVSLFTVGGTTRAIMGATFPGAPDVTAPTAGTLTASGETHLGFALTASGASDNVALSGTPYAFSTDNGVTWSAWQASPSLTVTGLTPETSYTCKHKVRDAATNEAQGAAIAATTAAAPAPTGYSGAVMGLSPVGYWKLDETTGTTAADSSGNGRHGTYSGTYALAGQNGFAMFGAGGLVTVPDATAFSMQPGLSIIALVRSGAWSSAQEVVAKRGSGYEWAARLPGSDAGAGQKFVEMATWAPNGDDSPSATSSSVESHSWGAWHLIVWSVPNASTASTQAWVDGVARTLSYKGGTGTPGDTASPVTIGADGNALAHVAIVAGGLTAGQVAALVTAAQGEGLIA